MVVSETQRLIVIFAFEGATLLDIVGPAEVFDIAARYVVAPRSNPYRVVIASVEGGPIRASSGLTIETTGWAELVDAQIDTIMVPGGGPPDDPPMPEPIVQKLIDVAPTVRRICAICTGTFLLAAAGLTRDRRVTTHWMAVDRLKELFPDTIVDADPVFVQDGPVWSSAGFTAGIDVAIALIEADQGYSSAIQLARLLILFLKRPGVQSQFSLPLATQMACDGSFADLHAFASANLTSNLSVERLAHWAGMSPRTFARRYVEKVGRTPASTVAALRLDAACRLLTETQVSFNEIARRTGFSDEQALRRTCQRKLGLTPEVYRDRFRNCVDDVSARSMIEKMSMRKQPNPTLGPVAFDRTAIASE
jgi:transcriptional regulator GlxA family with amidase domain